MRGNGPLASRKRQLDKTHCPKGHPYNDENTYVSSNGARHCRACKRERNKIWMSSYHKKNKDRSFTTLMLPEEY